MRQIRAVFFLSLVLVSSSVARPILMEAKANFIKRHSRVNFSRQSSCSSADSSEDLPLSPPSRGGARIAKKEAPVMRSNAGLRLALLGTMVLQNSLVVLVGRYTRSHSTETFVVSHFILVTEASKLLGSAVLESYVTKGNLIHSVRQNILRKPASETFKVAIPAILYLLQNSLLYVALSNLSAPLFQVTYQSKLLTTALVSVFLLDRRYTAQQWVCLAALGIGVAIVVLGEKKDVSTTAATEQNMFVGLIAVLISCFSSAFAGVYFEKVLKKVGNASPSGENAPPEQPMSMWLRNIQLASFSLVIAFGQYVYQANKGLASVDAVKPFFYGFDGWVWFLVTLQAGGGLLIAAVMKYADNVLKGLATGVAVAVSTLCSVFLFNTPLTMQFCIGASIILACVYWFSNGAAAAAPPAPKATDASKELSSPSKTEMKPMLQSV